MTPAEYQADDAKRVDQIRLSGQLLPREKEFFRKDGSRVPVLIGSALLAGSADQSISFVLDLTERKRAEAEARESERRFQEMPLELAHANRVATMGQLISSIAHEVKQPISAAAINASAALNWLDRTPPDLKEVRISLEQIVKDANPHVVRRPPCRPTYQNRCLLHAANELLYKYPTPTAAKTHG